MLPKAAKDIRLVILDVDGVLTDGSIILGKDEQELKIFNSRDGQGIHMLRACGIDVAIITKRLSAAVEKRGKELHIEHVYQGQHDKRIPYAKLLEKLHYTIDQVAYIGDDLVDLPLIRCSAIGATVADAPEIIREHADWISQYPGGRGAVREFADLLMQTQDKYDDYVKGFLQ